MDIDEIHFLTGKYFHLKHYFYGVFAADNFPKLTRKGFVAVNASPAQYEGSRWMVIFFSKTKFIWLTRLESRYKTTKFCFAVWYSFTKK